MNEVLRQEKKFLITLEQYYRYSHRFSQIMMEDSHNGSDRYTLIPLMIVILRKRKLVLSYEEKFACVIMVQEVKQRS